MRGRSVFLVPERGKSETSSFLSRGDSAGELEEEVKDLGYQIVLFNAD